MGTVVGVWRLKLLLIVFMCIVSIYLCHGFFYLANYNTVSEEGYMVYDDTSTINDYNMDNFTLEQNKGLGFTDMLIGAWDLLTFGEITNIYVRLLTNMITLSLWIVILYIIYTFIKEWVPFV